MVIVTSLLLVMPHTIPFPTAMPFTLDTNYVIYTAVFRYYCDRIVTVVGDAGGTHVVIDCDRHNVCAIAHADYAGSMCVTPPPLVAPTSLLLITVNALMLVTNCTFGDYYASVCTTGCTGT